MKLNRRDLLKMSGAALIGAAGARPRNAWAADPDEVYPTSPHILDPFSDELPVPLPLQPETSRVTACRVARRPNTSCRWISAPPACGF